MELAEQIDDADIMAVALIARGAAFVAPGQGGHAMADLTEALKLATDTGNTYVHVLALIGLANTRRYADGDRQALEYAGTARDLSSRAGFRHLERVAERLEATAPGRL